MALSLHIANEIRLRLLKLKLKLLLKSGLIDIYQPLPWFGIKGTQRHVSSLKRWEAIQRELGSIGGSGGSALDIGCNLGFFSFQLARNGFFCLGIEANRFLYHLCNLEKEVGKFQNAVFMEGFLDEKLCRKLPIVDVTLFLSVFHHLVRESGIEAATRVVVSLMKNTRKIMFFETGQSNETNTSWARYLPEMHPNPSEWIKKYFFSLGASNVKSLGEYQTHLSAIPRSLFAIYLD
jgi:hypothetical protein